MIQVDSSIEENDLKYPEILVLKAATYDQNPFLKGYWALWAWCRYILVCVAAAT